MLGAQINGVSALLFGALTGLALGAMGGSTFGVQHGVASGVAFGVAAGLTFGVPKGVPSSVAGGLAGGIALGLTTGFFVSSKRSVMRGVTFGGAAGVVFGIACGVAFGVAIGTGNALVGRALAGGAFGVAFAVACAAIIPRLDAALLGTLPALFSPLAPLAIRLQRASVLPIPRLRRRLKERLEQNWIEGLCECEGLLRYSLQFFPVTAALEEALASTPEDHLLPRVAYWCSMDPFDWRAVFFQSASLHSGRLRESWDAFWIIPRRWRPHIVIEPRYDTPARAACAGFWHLHEGAAQEATAAFERVRDLPHGEELYANAKAFAAALDCRSLEQIADWRPPERPPGELLRPDVRGALEDLGTIARDIALVQRSRSVRQRSSALNRASGALRGLWTEREMEARTPQQGERASGDAPSSPSVRLTDWPEPERGLIDRIAREWLEIVLRSAGAVGTLEVREPVASPYIAGASVPAERIAGRRDIFNQITAAWAKPGKRDSLVIYGHRRMGKTSIARNLLHFCRFGSDTGLAFLNLQAVDWSQGLADLCYAIAFELWKALPTELAEPLPVDFDEHPLAKLRGMLACLDRQAGRDRYILVLDEYELIDQKLAQTAADEFIALLRGLTQQYPWLVMALVGLHTLQERAASFYQAIFAWRGIRVGLMDRDSFADMLQVEHEDFPLEYSLEGVERAYVLTGGQPFLGQLLGDSLVRRFNGQLRHELERPSPTFSVEDVDAVVAEAQFYRDGNAYFDGIWAQAGEVSADQHAVLKALCGYEEGLEGKRLRELCSGLTPIAFDAALDALARHDVLTTSNDHYRYSVELMRRWALHLRDGQ